MAVILTGDETRSAKDRASMIRITRIAAVALTAKAPRAAGSIRRIVMSRNGLTRTRKRVAEKNWGSSAELFRPTDGRGSRPRLGKLG